jgi:hypothetical protein
VTRAPIERDKPLVTYLSRPDREAFDAAVQASGLTRAAYLRAVIRGTTPRAAALDLKAVETLAKVNADQARLGNLLKLYLQDRNPDRRTVARLLTDIEAGREELRAAVRRVAT